MIPGAAADSAFRRAVFIVIAVAVARHAGMQ